MPSFQTAAQPSCSVPSEMASLAELAERLAPLLQYKKTIAFVSTVAGVYYLKRQHDRRQAVRVLHPPAAEKTTRKRDRHSGKIDAEFVKRVYYVLRHTVPFLSRETLTATVLAAALIGRTFFTLVIAGNMGRSLKYLTSRNWESLWYNVGDFVILTIPAAILNASLRYLTSELELNVRDKITAKIHQLYMQNMNYYKANKVGQHRLENADQLIAEDVQKFSQMLSEVYSNFLKPVVDFVIFSVQLGRLTGKTGPLGMYAFFAFAAWVASIVLPAYGRMAVRTQELEGNFRARHARIIENSEMVAFMGGEKPEKRLLDMSFIEIRDYLKWTFNQHFYSYTITSFVNKYLASLQGMLILLIPLVRNERGMGSFTGSEIVSYYVETRQIMEGISDAVLRLFDVQKQVGTLAGLTSRVYNLLHLLREPEVLDLPRDPANPPEFIESDILSFKHVNVYKPDGTLLVKDLTFDVPPGTRIIITGENGAGKTSLFRVLRGLWPLAQGTITSPKPTSLKSFYFLSQVNFVPIGTLREIIIYPHTVEDFKNSGKTDEDLWKVLEMSHISDLSVNGQKPTMDTELDWQALLSPGQKQRMAFARLLYHCPKYAVLDECTNGIQPDVEADLYNRCAKMGITVFSISHKIELKAMHDYELHYDGQGGYQLIKLHD